MAPAFGIAVLAVETEFSRVRGEIESMESQRKNLVNQWISQRYVRPSTKTIRLSSR